MTKKEAFDALNLVKSNIVKLVLLRQKKFLETGDKTWMYGPNAHMEEMEKEYEVLIEKYKELGGIVIGLAELFEGSGLEELDNEGDGWKNE